MFADGRGPTALVPIIVPPLCPLRTHPFDFSHTRELIERAEAGTRQWLKDRLPQEAGSLPHELEPHRHDDAELAQYEAEGSS